MDNRGYTGTSDGEHKNDVIRPSQRTSIDRTTDSENENDASEITAEVSNCSIEHDNGSFYQDDDDLNSNNNTSEISKVDETHKRVHRNKHNGDEVSPSETERSFSDVQVESDTIKLDSNVINKPVGKNKLGNGGKQVTSENTNSSYRVDHTESDNIRSDSDVTNKRANKDKSDSTKKSRPAAESNYSCNDDRNKLEKINQDSSDNKTEKLSGSENERKVVNSGIKESNVEPPELKRNGIKNVSENSHCGHNKADTNVVKRQSISSRNTKGLVLNVTDLHTIKKKLEGEGKGGRGDQETVLDSIELEEIVPAQVDDDVDNEALLDHTHNGNPKLHVSRELFSQKQFEEKYEVGSRPSPTIRERLRKKASKCICSGACVKNFLVGMFPFLGIMRNYNIRQDLSGDIVSGLTVGIMHIPQGMAYGMLTTLPPVYGLYMSFFPVLIYFFFGSSKHISIGTFAVACLMIGSSVSKGYDAIGPKIAATSAPTTTTLSSINTTLSGNDTGSIPTISMEEEAMSQEELTIRLQFAMSVTFLVGIVQLLMGVCRLGFITVYLSDPLISGFTTGAACHVFTSQIKHVFGIKTARYSGAFKLIYTYMEFFQYIPHTNSITLITSILCIVLLYSVSRFINQNPKLKPKMFMPVPIELIVVVLGTLISYLVDLEGRYKVVIVNDIPTGLPMPNTYAFSHIGDVVSDAIALAIVIFAISISMGKLLAKKHDYEVDANQDLIAFGISTVFSSFFSSCAPSASLSRSLIQERVGGKTQLAGVVSCCLLLVVLLAIGPYFRTLPNCVLASIIIVALRGMFLQVLDLKKLWNVSIIDFMVWIVAFLATVVLDVDLGLAVAVIFAILTVVCRSQRPYACVLGQMGGTDIYRDINIYHEAREIPGIKIFRFEQSLFFVNTEHFRNCLYKRTVNPRELKKIQMKQEAKEEGPLPLKPFENNTESLEPNHHDPKEEVVVATGLSTPNIAVRHDVINLEVRVGGPKEKPAAPKPKPKPENPPGIDFHTIILDCSSWSFVDSMAVKVLTAVIGEYSSIGVKICLANCKGGIRDMFERTRFYETLDHSRIYISIHDAVIHSLHLESPAPTPSISTSSSERRIVPRRPLSPNVNFIDESSEKGGQREDGRSLISEDSDM